MRRALVIALLGLVGLVPITASANVSAEAGSCFQVQYRFCL